MDSTMRYSAGLDGDPFDLAEVFGDPAFAAAKRRDAAFVVVALGSREVLWANRSAAILWGAREPERLGRRLFGAAGSEGWLDKSLRGVMPDRPPQLARIGLAEGFRMRSMTLLAQSWYGPNGNLTVAFTVPESAGTADAPEDAWFHRAWTPPGGRNGMPPAGDLAVQTVTSTSEPVTPPDAASGISGSSLAKRSQIAVLRDRLNHAFDGAATLRILWRTGPTDAIVQLETETLTRLGTPLRLDGRAWPEIVDRFDPVAATALRHAFASRATWSGIMIGLPVAEGAAIVPMVLSASPIIGPDRAFAGFRGFGKVDLGLLDLAPRPAETVAMNPAEPVGSGTSADQSVVVEPATSPLRDKAASYGVVVSADERAGSDNVVHLRPFQPPVVVRPEATPTQGASAPLPITGWDNGTEVLSPASSQSDDDLAFIALRDALQARIASSSDHDRSETGHADRSASVAPLTITALAGVEVVPDGAAGVVSGAATVERTGASLRPPPETSLLDRLPIAVAILHQREPAYANAAASRLLGFDTPAALVNAGPALVVSPDIDAETAALVVRAAEGQAVTIPAQAVAVEWRGEDATLWLLGEAARGPRPSTDASRTDDGEGRSSELLDRVDDAVAVLDGHGLIRKLNHRGQLWFAGTGRERLLGQSFTEMLVPESRATGLALLGELRGQETGVSGSPLSRDVRALTGDAAHVPMVLTMGRLGSNGFYATLRDVSALRSAETDRARFLDDREREAGRLHEVLAKVSHEIRTPLNAILGFAEVMMDERFGPLGNPRYRDYLKDIHASGTQVVALVSDLLDLSNVESGRIELDVGAVDVNRLVAETVARMQPEARRERVIMRTSLTSRIPHALADERSARQIVHNLLSNAVKFNEPGGQVIVSTAVSETGTVLLRVRDTGVGMTDAEIAAALEPFQQMTQAANGNGLGLPVTRALVGANGASMSIRSRPREGTLVEVAFTAATSEPARLPP